MMTIFVLAGFLLAATGQQAANLAEGWDFVPGEKILLFDDFTDMPKGGSPPHWKVRGASVKLSAEGRLLATQTTQLYPNVTAWPKNFTIEQDFTLNNADNCDLSWQFDNGEGERVLRFWIRFHPDNNCNASLEGPEGEIGAAECKYEDAKLNTLNLWTQDGRVRIYLNGARLIDVNQVTMGNLTQGWMETDPNEGAQYAFARVRIAESSPDFSKTILSSGRFVTHGITFDVNSDRLRPESGPVLKVVADAMKEQSGLKLKIEGHTDSTGDAAKNLDLSRRRAEAVKAALVSQFGIAADRLTTEGLGQTKPVKSNDAPEGRAENRRVEFVKM
jgi:OOP family OmpA-OmpF porin